MSEERMRVLEMVDAGVITPEQGMQLLDVLGPDPGERAVQPQPKARMKAGHGRHDGSRPRHRELRRLAAAATHGIDAGFVQQMRELGFEHLDLDTLIQLRIADVDAAYVEEVRALGYTDLDPRELAHLKLMGLTRDFVREMGALGLAGDVLSDDQEELENSVSHSTVDGTDDEGTDAETTEFD